MKLTLFETTPAAKNHLVWKEGKVMVFRKPAGDKRMGLLLSIGLMVQLVALPLICAFLTEKIDLWVLVALGVGLTYYFCFVLNFAGPDDIRLDGNEGIYERTMGWWKSITRRGSFENIKDIRLGSQNQVWLRMQSQSVLSKDSVLLSSSGTQAAAQVLAEEVSREFGFPIVPYPK